MPELNLAKSEWHILNCLWERCPMTVMELAEALGDSLGWARSTTITNLKRMEAKGLVRSEAAGRGTRYYPAVEKRDAARTETKSFLERVYRGSVGLMLSAMADEKALTREEIAQLYDILRQAEEGQ